MHKIFSIIFNCSFICIITTMYMQVFDELNAWCGHYNSMTSYTGVQNVVQAGNPPPPHPLNDQRLSADTNPILTFIYSQNLTSTNTCLYNMVFNNSLCTCVHIIHIHLCLWRFHQYIRNVILYPLECSCLLFPSCRSENNNVPRYNKVITWTVISKHIVNP